MKTFVVQYTREALFELEIEAESDEQAVQKFKDGDWDLQNEPIEIDGINEDIKSVREIK